jgi:hypothetical protein
LSGDLVSTGPLTQLKHFSSSLVKKFLRRPGNSDCIPSIRFHHCNSIQQDFHRPKYFGRIRWCNWQKALQQVTFINRIIFGPPPSNHFSIGKKRSTGHTKSRSEWRSSKNSFIGNVVSALIKTKAGKSRSPYGINMIGGLNPDFQKNRD